jgi:hypothetical protein
VLQAYREVVLSRHGMEARRAETPDVALAAPFTTARPPEAGRQKKLDQWDANHLNSPQDGGCQGRNLVVHRKEFSSP